MTGEDRSRVPGSAAAGAGVSWPRGAAVAWRSVPGGAVGTAFPVRVVRDDPELIALYLTPGACGRRRAGKRGGPRGRQLLPGGWSGAYEERVWRANRAQILYRPGDAHSVWLFWPEGEGGEAALSSWYVNLEAPWRRSAVGFDTRDHTGTWSSPPTSAPGGGRTRTSWPGRRRWGASRRPRRRPSGPRATASWSASAAGRRPSATAGSGGPPIRRGRSPSSPPRGTR